jgi:large subunit ribosomal protein L29
MELQKIRSLSAEELTHHEKITSEQLFRLRFQVSLGQNDGVKKLRQLRKEIAQIKTVARAREIGIQVEEVKQAEPAAVEKPVKKAKTKTKAKTAVPAAEKKAKKAKEKGAPK